ncbi:HNH endonuclease [Microlunatus flavus]|nr:HNH endonuclease signature motif containing protein [Microlunatus flavus]
MDEVRGTGHEGLTPQQVERAAERAEADALAGRICAAAALAAQSEAQLLDLVGEFDASGAVRYWTDVKSVAHWLGWACSMTPGVAREHVRVARALRRMPTVRAAFAEGRLSYSKVRELTRVVDQVDDAQLCVLALTATASQLARTVAGFRAAQSLRMRQEDKRAVSWRTREDGMVELRGLLPAEEGALLVAALEAARERLRAPEPARETAPETTAASAAEGSTERSQADTTPRPRNADALLDVARLYLDAAPEDRSGEDRTLVVVHVAAEQLAEDVPAGTSVDPTCHVEGVGRVEPETARRLACHSTLLGAVVDRHGQVLALGRTRRLVSKAQRRALMIRDQGMCQFPGCHQTRHLDAHHRVAWAAGGRTDLDNLVLLCGRHHTCVHEGGLRLRPHLGARGFDVVTPEGTRLPTWWDADQLAYQLREEVAQSRAAHAATLAAVDGFAHPAARRVRPGWTGERFDLHECVDALFRMGPAQAAVLAA